MMSKALPRPVKIEFQGFLDAGSAQDMQELYKILASNEELTVSGSDSGSNIPTGTKFELVSVLAIVGAITGVTGLVLQGIAIWKEDKPKYSITITEGDLTYTADNLSRESYLELIQRLNQSQADISIQISSQ